MSEEMSNEPVHRDLYCVTHCRQGVKHSQCGCPCDHQSFRPERGAE